MKLLSSSGTKPNYFTVARQLEKNRGRTDEKLGYRGTFKNWPKNRGNPDLSGQVGSPDRPRMHLVSNQDWNWITDSAAAIGMLCSTTNMANKASAFVTAAISSEISEDLTDSVFGHWSLILCKSNIPWMFHWGHVPLNVELASVRHCEVSFANSAKGKTFPHRRRLDERPLLDVLGSVLLICLSRWRRCVPFPVTFILMMIVDQFSFRRGWRPFSSQLVIVKWTGWDEKSFEVKYNARALLYGNRIRLEETWDCIETAALIGQYWGYHGTHACSISCDRKGDATVTKRAIFRHWEVRGSLAAWWLRVYIGLIDFDGWKSTTLDDFLKCVAIFILA